MKRMTVYFMGILLYGIVTWQPAYSITNERLQEPMPKNEQVADKIRIFPNPTNGRFQISMDYEGKDRIVAKVYDITGKVIKDISDDLVKAESKVTADVDLDHPSSGIYFLRVKIGNDVATRKIIVK